MVIKFIKTPEEKSAYGLPNQDTTSVEITIKDACDMSELEDAFYSFLSAVGYPSAYTDYLERLDGSECDECDVKIENKVLVDENDTLSDKIEALEKRLQDHQTSASMINQSYANRI